MALDVWKEIENDHFWELIIYDLLGEFDPLSLGSFETSKNDNLLLICAKIKKDLLFRVIFKTRQKWW